MGCGPSQIIKLLLFALVLITHLSVSVIGSPGLDGGHVRRPRRHYGSYQAPNQRAMVLQHRRSGYNVRIRGSQVLDARGKPHHNDSVLILKSVKIGDRVGLRIQSNIYKTYLCFSKTGYLKLRHKGNNLRCTFIEGLSDGYITLRSAANENWYVGFRRRGIPMRGTLYAGASPRRKRCFQFHKKRYRHNRPRNPKRRKGNRPHFSKLALHLLKLKKGEKT